MYNCYEIAKYHRSWNQILNIRFIAKFAIALDKEDKPKTVTKKLNTKIISV